MSMYIGEALVGDGNEIAHIDLLIGECVHLLIDLTRLEALVDHFRARIVRREAGGWMGFRFGLPGSIRRQ